MGYCKTCEKLVAIKPGKHKGEGREQWWFPYDHSDRDGKPCDGAKRGI